MTDEGTVFHLLIDHSHGFKITQQIIFQVIQTSGFVCPDVCPKGIWILEEISQDGVAKQRCNLTLARVK